MVMPQQWYDRMATISNYEQDPSAMGRINSWHMAFNLAKDRPLGAGFESFRDAMFAMYAPDPGDVHDSHSIYFQVLGHHGFLGLFLFLLLGVMTWRTESGEFDILAVDCGTSSVNEVADLKKRGIHVIILDHHEP